MTTITQIPCTAFDQLPFKVLASEKDIPPGSPVALKTEVRVKEIYDYFKVPSPDFLIQPPAEPKQVCTKTL